MRCDVRHALVWVFLAAAVLLPLSGCGMPPEDWHAYDPIAAASSVPHGHAMDGGTYGVQPDAGRTDGRPAAGAPESAGDAGSGEELLVWGDFPDALLSQFEKTHPDVPIRHETQMQSEFWISAISSGNAADVFAYPAVDAGWASVLDIFEPLDGNAYGLSGLYADMTRTERTEGTSLGDGRFVSLPLYTYPVLLLYRVDILRAIGWPTDPDMLAERLEEPGAWLSMARRLKQDGRYAMEWSDAPWDVGNLVWNPFSVDLTWRLNTPEMQAALSTSVVARKENLAAETDIWTDGGQWYLRNDKLVMCLLSAKDLDRLAAWCPEQKGLWRVTRMPLGLSSEAGSTWVSMNRDSPHKAAAWELMAYSWREARTRQKSLDTDASAYFGGQNLHILVKKERERMTPVFPTPFDADAEKLFQNNAYLLFDGKMTSAQALEGAQREVGRTFRVELAAIRHARGLN